MLVVGGGPAGSTAAALLARKGYRVTLIEKARHPRFHIGESLLPANLPLLERLGVAQQVREIGMQKWGAEFICPRERRQQDYRFCEAWNKSMPYRVSGASIRVRPHPDPQRRAPRRRGHRGRARQCGGFRRQQSAPITVQVQAEDGAVSTWRARFLVDASGRDTFLANTLQSKRRNRQHNSAAHIRPFQRCAPQCRRARGPHIDLLVRSWLVLVHPAQ